MLKCDERGYHIYTNCYRIVDARIARGYGDDHLITGDECSSVIGRHLDTVGDCTRAAVAAARKNANKELLCNLFVTVKMERLGQHGEVVERLERTV